MVRDFCLGFFGEVGNLNLSLLLDLHEVLLDLLDLCLIFRDLLLQLFFLQIFLVLDPFDFHVQVFLLFQQLPQLVLILKFMSDEGVELLSGVIFNEFV